MNDPAVTPQNPEEKKRPEETEPPDGKVKSSITWESVINFLLLLLACGLLSPVIGKSSLFKEMSSETLLLLLAGGVLVTLLVRMKQGDGTRVGDFFDKMQGNWLMLGIATLVGYILWAVVQRAPVIEKLTDASFARGLITFIICVAAVGMGFVLVYQAFADTKEDDKDLGERFRRAREIFAGLMGIMGTIVGFYFGTADSGPGLLQMAPVKVDEKEISTFVSGGMPPYTFSITAEPPDAFKPVKNEQSGDGWIKTATTGLKPKSKVTIEVKDSANRGTSVQKTYEAVPPANPPSVQPENKPNP